MRVFEGVWGTRYEGPEAESTSQFKEWLRQVSGIPVECQIVTDHNSRPLGSRVPRDVAYVYSRKYLDGSLDVIPSEHEGSLEEGAPGDGAVHEFSAPENELEYFQAEESWGVEIFHAAESHAEAARELRARCDVLYRAQSANTAQLEELQERTREAVAGVVQKVKEVENSVLQREFFDALRVQNVHDISGNECRLFGLFDEAGALEQDCQDLLESLSTGRKRMLERLDLLLPTEAMPGLASPSTINDASGDAEANFDEMRAVLERLRIDEEKARRLLTRHTRYHEMQLRPSLLQAAAMLKQARWSLQAEYLKLVVARVTFLRAMAQQQSEIGQLRTLIFGLSSKVESAAQLMVRCSSFKSLLLAYVETLLSQLQHQVWYTGMIRQHNEFFRRWKDSIEAERNKWSEKLPEKTHSQSMGSIAKLQVLKPGFEDLAAPNLLEEPQETQQRKLQNVILEVISMMESLGLKNSATDDLKDAVQMVFQDSFSPSVIDKSNGSSSGSLSAECAVSPGADRIDIPRIGSKSGQMGFRRFSQETQSDAEKVQAYEMRIGRLESMLHRRLSLSTAFPPSLSSSPASTPGERQQSNLGEASVPLNIIRSLNAQRKGSHDTSSLATLTKENSDLKIKLAEAGMALERSERSHESVTNMLNESLVRISGLESQLADLRSIKADLMANLQDQTRDLTQRLHDCELEANNLREKLRDAENRLEIYEQPTDLDSSGLAVGAAAPALSPLHDGTVVEGPNLEDVEETSRHGMDISLRQALSDLIFGIIESVDQLEKIFNATLASKQVPKTDLASDAETREVSVSLFGSESVTEALTWPETNLTSEEACSRLRDIEALVRVRVTDKLYDGLQGKFAQLAAQLQYMEHKCDKYRHRSQSFAKESSERIAYRSFKVGDLALFLPTRSRGSKSPWAAFNVGAPHYFLRVPPVKREWLVARIASIEPRVTGAASVDAGFAERPEGTAGAVLGDGEAGNGVGKGKESSDGDDPYQLGAGVSWWVVDIESRRKKI